MNLGIDNRKKYEENLNEEFIDMFIYMMRISNYLDIDVENEYKKKLNNNIERFKKYEIDNDNI